MRILTGIQPSGRLHLGNYLGAMKQCVDLQKKADDCYYFIADYHALTTVSDPQALRDAIHGVAILAALVCALCLAGVLLRYRRLRDTTASRERLNGDA